MVDVRHASVETHGLLTYAAETVLLIELRLYGRRSELVSLPKPLRSVTLFPFFGA